MKEFRIYKPKKDEKGAAAKFQFVVKARREGKFPEPMLFLEMANQTGVDANDNASFDWAGQDNSTGNSVTVKLGIPDVSELLLALRRHKDEGKLFHKNDKGNTTVGLKKFHDQMALNVSSQRGEDKKLTRVGLMVSPGECIVLSQLLGDFISAYYGWVDYTDEMKAIRQEFKK